MMNLSMMSLKTLALFAALTLPMSGWAESGNESQTIDFEQLAEDRAAIAKKHPLGSRIQRYLAAASEAAEAGDPGDGIRLLDKLNPKRLNPYERTFVYRLRATLSYASGEYDEAIEYFQKTVDEQVLRVDAENAIRFGIAQIHASLEHWQETIDGLNRFFRYVEEEPDPLAYYLIGIAYYRLDQIDQAIVYTEKSIDASVEPKEGWLQLLSALHVQNKDYASATPVLEELVVRFPKKAYWVQLSLIYGARDNYRYSLVAQQVAYFQGLLTEDRELRRLARSYLYHELPYQAGRVLEQGLAKNRIEADSDAYELLANSWIAAREYDLSLPSLLEAAALAEDGNLHVRLGQVYLQREEWKQAAQRLSEAIEKGGLQNEGSAQLLLGIALYNDERVGKARKSFERAAQHDSTRTAAKNWIDHLNEEASSS